MSDEPKVDRLWWCADDGLRVWPEPKPAEHAIVAVDVARRPDGADASARARWHFARAAALFDEHRRELRRLAEGMQWEPYGLRAGDPNIAPPSKSEWERRLRWLTIDEVAQLWSLTADEFALLPGPAKMYVEASPRWEFVFGRYVRS